MCEAHNEDKYTFQKGSMIKMVIESVLLLNVVFLCLYEILKLFQKGQEAIKNVHGYMGSFLTHEAVADSSSV